MYELRLTYSMYNTGILLKYEDSNDAARFAASIVKRSEPVNGDELMAIITKIPEAPEIIEDDDGSGVGQTFSP